MVFACGCAFVGCTVVGCGMSSAALSLGYGSSAAMSPAARCPLHVVCCTLSRCISAFRSIRRVWCTFCVTAAAARFSLLVFRCPLPSCMVPAARRLLNVVCCTSSVCAGRMCSVAFGCGAPPRPMRLACPVGCLLQSQVAPWSGRPLHARRLAHRLAHAWHCLRLHLH